VDGLAVTVRSVRLDAQDDPPCCRFSRASSDVFLCSLWSLLLADTVTTSPRSSGQFVDHVTQPVRHNARRLVRISISPPREEEEPRALT
jgi:hypothetical protein